MVPRFPLIMPHQQAVRRTVAGHAAAFVRGSAQQLLTLPLGQLRIAAQSPAVLEDEVSRLLQARPARHLHAHPELELTQHPALVQALVEELRPALLRSGHGMSDLMAMKSCRPLQLPRHPPTTRRAAVLSCPGSAGRCVLPLPKPSQAGWRCRTLPVATQAERAERAAARLPARLLACGAISWLSWLQSPLALLHMPAALRLSGAALGLQAAMQSRR